MGWISIREQLPPSDGTKIHTWDKVYGPTYTETFAGVALQHIHYDIAQLGYSRITHWAYANDADLAILFGTQKAKEMKDEREVLTRKVKKPVTEPDSFTREEIEATEKEKQSNVGYESEGSSEDFEWTSENGKWTVKVNGSKENGSITDNKTGKHSIWRLDNKAIKVTGTKIPKYVYNKILEMIDK